jgi:hypothetical protein
MFKQFLILEAEIEQDLENMDSAVALRALRQRMQALQGRKQELAQKPNDKMTNLQRQELALEEDLIRIQIELVKEKENASNRAAQGA